MEFPFECQTRLYGNKGLVSQFLVSVLNEKVINYFEQTKLLRTRDKAALPLLITKKFLKLLKTETRETLLQILSFVHSRKRKNEFHLIQQALIKQIHEHKNAFKLSLHA